MPTYDKRCRDCGYESEERRRWDDPVSQCDHCGGECDTIYKTYPNYTRVKDPYDMLHGSIPDPKPIKSFAKDRRRGGKNTV